MRAARLGSVLGATTLLLCTLAVGSQAQQTAKRYPPSIQIYSTNGATVLNTSSYVTPEIRVAENAYVFAVMMDLDGQIRVLHPDFPGISVKISAHKSVQLPNFFTGFNQAPYVGFYSAQFQTYSEHNGYGDTRGTVLALASRAPFHLERLEVGGDWDMVAIRRLIEDRTPQGAMLDLASYIGAEGEPIGRDYMRFSGGSSNYYASDYYDSYYDSYYSPCNYYFGPATVAKLRASRGNRVPGKIVGYDACGFPIVSLGVVTQGHFPQTGPPLSPRDSLKIPKNRYPRDNPRYHPPRSASLGAPTTVFPVVHRTDLPQMGDVTITAPKGRRAEPGQVLEGYRSQGGTVFSAPQGRMPIERTIPTEQPAAIAGGQTVREYHPEPRVQSPPPSRMPEASTQKPAAPSSPPPRGESVPTRSEPLRPVPEHH